MWNKLHNKMKFKVDNQFNIGLYQAFIHADHKMYYYFHIYAIFINYEDTYNEILKIKN